MIGSPNNSIASQNAKYNCGEMTASNSSPKSSFASRKTFSTVFKSSRAIAFNFSSSFSSSSFCAGFFLLLLLLSLLLLLFVFETLFFDCLLFLPSFAFFSATLSHSSSAMKSMPAATCALSAKSLTPFDINIHFPLNSACNICDDRFKSSSKDLSMMT